MTLQEAVEMFVAARLGVSSRQTLAWYRSRLGRLVAELGAAAAVQEIDLAALRRWRASLFEQRRRWQNHPHVPEQRGGLSAHTADGHWRAARAFFQWLTDEGHLTSNPATRLERPSRPDVPPKRVSREAVRKLLEAARQEGPRDLALVRFLLATGVRAAECCGMTRGALDLTEGRVEVHGKGNKTRVVYFDAVTAGYLRAYLDTRQDTRAAVWLTQDHARALTIGGLRSLLRRLCDQAGVEHQGGLHALRHTFAYEFLRAGGDPDMLRKQMGHSSLKTTYDSYVRWMDQDRQSALADSWLEQFP